MENRTILFYDGDCGLCQRSVRVLARLDRHQKLFFAPLNGKTYGHTGFKPSSMDTVLFYNDSHLYEKSDAIIECLFYLSQVYFFVRLFKLIPRKLRDICYDFVAKNRHHVSCQLFVKDHRFLD
jgi:predicted DCC family thiol-disulfide oxidoreductase YuxK